MRRPFIVKAYWQGRWTLPASPESSVGLCIFMSRLKQLLWDRLEESGWRYDVEEHAEQLS